MSFQNLVCPIQDRCQGYFDILSNNMLKISLSQTILHHVWSSIVHPGKYKPSFTSLQHSFRTNSWGNPAIWVQFWTYPWARPWCPVWPWPPAGPDYFPPGLLCPSPSAPYSILLSSGQNNQTKEDFSYLWKFQNWFLSFPSGFPTSSWDQLTSGLPQLLLFYRFHSKTKHLHICSWCT